MTPRYVEWTSGPVLELGTGFATVIAEWLPDGYVDREIALNQDGVIIHKAPSRIHRHGEYGLLMDGPPFDVEPLIRHGLVREITADEFLEIWAQPVPQPPPEHAIQTGTVLTRAIDRLFRRRT